MEPDYRARTYDISIQTKSIQLMALVVGEWVIAEKVGWDNKGRATLGGKLLEEYCDYEWHDFLGQYWKGESDVR